MKKSLFAGAAASLSVAAILIACGDDDSSSSITQTASKLDGLVVSADELPKCTSAKDGKILVADEEIAICDERAWTAFVCGEKDGDEINAAAKLSGDALVITCDGDSIGVITKADVEGCEIAKGDEQVSLVCDEDTLATVAVKKETESSSSKAKSSESKDESSSSKAKSSESKDESSSSKAKSSESKESSSSKAKSSESKESSSSKASSSSAAPVSSTVPASSSSATPTSSAAEPESSAAEPESSAAEPESSSEEESSSSAVLLRDERWAFLDPFVEWTTAQKGTVIENKAFVAALQKEEFTEVESSSSTKGYEAYKVVRLSKTEAYTMAIKVTATGIFTVVIKDGIDIPGSSSSITGKSSPFLRSSSSFGKTLN